MAKIPFLIVSDNPTGYTGLGRIARELAERISSLSDTFEVGVAGYGGTSTKNSRYPVYPFSLKDGWVIRDLPKIWDDFAGGRRGIIFTIWNASWLNWMVNPNKLPQGDLKSFMKAKPFDLWGYFPIDSTGPKFGLSDQEKEVFSKFDRVLAYTKFGSDVIRATIFNESKRSIDFLPHGTDTNVFHPRPKKDARKTFIKTVQGGDGEISSDITMIGVVGTNSRRKNWPLAFQVCEDLLRRGFNVGMWCHTDKFVGEYDLKFLASRFSMDGRVVLSNRNLSDDALSCAYAACDAVICPSTGEGWGLTGSEALACGVPAFHGAYAGQAEFTPREFLVEPAAFYYDGIYANARPVFDASLWADKMDKFITNNDGRRRSFLGAKYSWTSCWTTWREWILKGVNG